MNEKQVAGQYAAKYVADGMIVGLGTGSTVYYTILEIGRHVKEGLLIQAVATSTSTEKLAYEHNIPLIHPNSVTKVDVAIDGADEVNPRLDGIKGGGGALLREKMVALSAEENIWVVDEKKLVDKLGVFSLPIEVVPFLYQHTRREIEKMGINVKVRQSEEGTPFITDNHHYLFDLSFDARIENPAYLNQQLKQITGVVETGFFLDIADKVVIGLSDGNVRIKTRTGHRDH